jgi:hypothetical protein
MNGRSDLMAAQFGQAAQTGAARDWPWARLTAAAGIAFVVLVVAGFTVRGIPPTPGEPVAEARAYYLQHRTGVLTYAYLDGLAMICLVAFAAGFGGLVARRGGDPLGILARLTLAGAIGTAAIAMVLDMIEGALASQIAADGELAAVQALFAPVSMLPLTALPQALFLAGAAAGIVRSAVVPRWLGFVALVPALSGLVGAAGLGDPSGPVAAISLVGGYLPMLLWMLAVSITLFVRREGSMPVTGEQPAHAANQRWQPEA